MAPNFHLYADLTPNLKFVTLTVPNISKLRETVTWSKIKGPIQCWLIFKAQRVTLHFFHIKKTKIKELNLKKNLLYSPLTQPITKTKNLKCQHPHSHQLWYHLTHHHHYAILQHKFDTTSSIFTSKSRKRYCKLKILLLQEG